jgi:spore coat protein CotF
MSDDNARSMSIDQAAKEMGQRIRDRHSGPIQDGVADATITDLVPDPNATHTPGGYPTGQEVSNEEVEAVQQEGRGEEDSGERSGEAVPEEVQQDESGQSDTTGAEDKGLELHTMTDAELEATFLKGNVYGEEKEISLKDVRDNWQQYLAADKKLDDNKALSNELRMELERTRQMQEELKKPAVDPKPEFMTEQDEELWNLKQELNQLKGAMTQTQVQQLVEAEDAQIRQIARDELGTEDMNRVAMMIQQVQQSDPNFTAITQDIFSGPPQDQGHLQRRLAMFRATLTQGKSMAVPEIVQQAKAEGLQEGKKETMAKVKKESLTTVSSTAPAPERSMKDLMSAAQAQPGIGGYTDVWKKKFGKDVPQY